MFVRIAKTGDGAQASLVEPLEFTSFSLNLDAGVELEEIRALAGVVRLESEEQAWISSEWLLAQPPYPDDESARNGVAGMIEYARKHGWVDDESGEIAAHVVRG